MNNNAQGRKLTPLPDFKKVLALTPNAIEGHYVTPNFQWGEFFIHRTKAQLRWVDMEILTNVLELALRLEVVRSHLGNRPLVITSGWRDPVSNRRSGGAKRSRHLTGEAVDFTVQGLTPKQVQGQLELVWDGGMGYGHTFTHLDTRGYKARFHY